MRTFIIGAALAATLIPVAGASAQPYGRAYGYHQRDVRQEMRECRRELRHADSRREYDRELRECRREIAQARRDSYGWDRYGRNDRRDRYWDGYRWRDRY